MTEDPIGSKSLGHHVAQKLRFSVLNSHVAWAHEGVDMMIGHTNAGASDLNSACIGLAGRTPALEDSLHLGGIDLESAI